MIIYYIDRLLIDKNSNATIIRSCPQSALFINIQAIYRFDRRNVLKIHKLCSIIFEQSRIGSDPQLSILCLCNIIGFAGYKAFLFRIDLLHIRIIVYCCFLRIRRIDAAKASRNRQNQQHEFCCSLKILFRTSSHTAHTFQQQIDNFHTHKLVQKFNAKLSDHIRNITGNAFIHAHHHNLISPHVSGHSIIQKRIDQNRNNGRKNGKSHSQSHGCKLPVKHVLFGKITDSNANQSSNNTINRLSVNKDSINDIIRKTDHGTTNRSSQICNQKCPNGIAP